MTSMVDLSLVRQSEALKTWAAECQARMMERWPAIQFEAAQWPMQTLYKTRCLDISFSASAQAFAERDPAYMLVLRCLAAEQTLEGKAKDPRPLNYAWRLMLAVDAPLASMTRQHLIDLEASVVGAATQSSAYNSLRKLQTLSQQLDELGRRGVVNRLAWGPSPKTRDALNKQRQSNRKTFQKEKAATLDSKIAALADATRAMLRGDDRLSNGDRAALAVMNILMCAPSRVNEPLCLGVADRYTIEDYAARSNERAQDELRSVHQLLLIKGSKGADWAPKPILNFMVDLVDACWNILLELGKRSRMLVSWYANNPSKLYLPPALEHLRSKDISKAALWQIVHLTDAAAPQTGLGAIYRILNDFKRAGIVRQIPNPNTVRSDGQKNQVKTIGVVPWDDLEPRLLERVNERLASLHRVTHTTRYEGTLSNMLMLLDSERTPYLPDAVNYSWLRRRFKQTASDKEQPQPPTIFEKLDIRMVEDSREVHAYIETHDPRRWLTTMALSAKERLSDVLINKWANRLDLGQLAAYDLRSGEEKADQAALTGLHELTDMTSGLGQLEPLETKYGLSTELVVAHDAGIAVTSVDAVFQATEDRPIARTGNQIVILYPTRFGVCLHQHHETPCRSYRKCVGCNEQIAVKGHLPTNDAWRRENDLYFGSIVNQLQALLTERDYEIADDPAALDEHLLTLVREGLDAEQMATELIERFHEIKDRIEDRCFRSKLHDAFVAREVVKKLDDPSVTSGAVIKYHNPSRHASPGHERALEARFGSREAMAKASEVFYQQHPEFAPTALGLQDESHLLANDSEDDDEDAA
jgi:hypothetical protein